MIIEEIGFDEYINFQRNITELLRENLKTYPIICKYPEVSKKIMQERLSCGLPVLSLEWLKMCLDHAIMEDFLEKILLVIKKHRLLNNENENKIQLMRNSVSSLPESLVFNYLKNHGGFFFEIKNDIRKIILDITEIIADVLSKHVVLDVIRKVPNIEDCINYIQWRENYCPFCGSEPYLVIICEEIKKIKLRCRICYTCWEIDKKQCPFCQNDNEQYLQTCHETIFPQFLLILCKNCKRYIKVMKESIKNEENVEVDVFLTDAMTITLDSIAQSNGYRGPKLKSDIYLLIEKTYFAKERTGGER